MVLWARIDLQCFDVDVDAAMFLLVFFGRMTGLGWLSGGFLKEVPKVPRYANQALFFLNRATSLSLSKSGEI